MYVRAGEPYTAKQVKDYDFLRLWLGRLETDYGISKAAFERDREDLSNQFGFRASSSDTVWKVLNSQITKIRTYPTEEHRSLYLDMADFVRSEGKDPRPHLQSANNVQSDLIKKRIQGEVAASSYSTAVKWHFRNNNDELVCASCRELEEKPLSAEAAVRLPLLCTGDFGCRCWPLVVVGTIDFEEVDAAPDTTELPDEQRRPWWKFWG